MGFDFHTFVGTVMKVLFGVLLGILIYDWFMVARIKARIELEMTLLMWRNHFTCDILAEKGSAHIESLCKWGPSTFVHRTRVLPSGRPPEEAVTLTQEDPTWALEYAAFKERIAAGAKTGYLLGAVLPDEDRYLAEYNLAATVSSLEEVERLLIRKTLDRYQGNVSQAAGALGLSRSALYRRLQRYGL